MRKETIGSAERSTNWASRCSSKLTSTIVELLLLLHSTILLHYYCVSRSSSRSLLAFEWGVTDFVQDFTKVVEGFYRGFAWCFYGDPESYMVQTVRPNFGYRLAKSNCMEVSEP